MRTVKKLLVIVFMIFIVGCGSSATKNGNSKTYEFFKNFNLEKYYVAFWDRNTSINDDAKIIMARDGDKYYYEFDGYERKIVIQKEGKRYNVNASKKEYFVSEADLQDFSVGVLPRNINNLKKQKYDTGTEKIYNKKYIYEKFTDGSESTTYYFKRDKLVYVKHVSIQNTVLLRFNYMKNDFSSKIFEIDKDFLEVTY